MLDRAQREPDALLRSAKHLVLDEVQRAPEILVAIKRAVDERRQPGRFVLTGSANLALTRRVAESLAGRAAYLSLWPMTRREQRGLGTAGEWKRLLDSKDKTWRDVLEQGSKGDREDWRKLALRGGYPTPAHELIDGESRSLWFSSYVQTYLERDLRELSAISDLVGFRRLMRATCLRIGNLVNQAELGRDIGMPQPTVRRHLDLLEASYQLIRVPAYSVSRTKRLIKTPKVYWTDTGLGMHLAGETAPRGAHLENIVLGDLLVFRNTEPDPPEVLYWRTAAGEEVDFVLERNGELLPIEVKSTTRPRLSDASALQSFRAEYPERSRAGLLLHGGEETSWLTEGVLATPWWKVL